MAEYPEFDRSRFSWRDRKMVDVIQYTVRRAAALLADPDTLRDPARFAEAVAEREKALTMMEGMLARQLVSVPRDWLVPGAPENIDWSEPQSLDWLQGRRIEELQAAMFAGTAPEDVSKN